jgi:hypothetical protein
VPCGYDGAFETNQASHLFANESFGLGSCHTSGAKDTLTFGVNLAGATLFIRFAWTRCLSSRRVSRQQRIASLRSERVELKTLAIEFYPCRPGCGIDGFVPRSRGALEPICGR